MRSPDESSRVEHIAGYHANSAIPCPHIVGICESRTHIYKTVEIGSPYLIVFQSPDRLVALVIRENEEYIRFVRPSNDVGTEQNHE